MMFWFCIVCWIKEIIWRWASILETINRKDISRDHDKMYWEIKLVVNCSLSDNAWALLITHFIECNVIITDRNVSQIYKTKGQLQ